MSSVSAGAGPRNSRRGATRRVGVLVGAAAVGAGDLGVKAWAETSLPAAGVDAGPIDLRLAHNPGVAFSFAAGLPAPAVLAATGLVTAAVVVFAWAAAPTASRVRLTGFTAVLGGAAANLVDRAADGRVTDYLYTGWWPTFNLADAAIVTGAALLLLSSTRQPRAEGGGNRRPGAGA